MKYIKYLILVLLILSNNFLLSQVIGNYWKDYEKKNDTEKQQALETEKTRLKPLIQTIKSLDPYYKNYSVQWIVDQKNIKVSLMNKLREQFQIYDINVFADLLNRAQADVLDIRLIQEPKEGLPTDEEEENPDTQPEIIALFIDNQYAIVGSDDISLAVGDELYALLQDRAKYRYTNITNYLDKSKRYSHISASLFGGDAVIFLNSRTIANEAGELPPAKNPTVIGAKIDIGYDMMNYPMWYGGIWNIMGFYAPTEDQYYSVGAIMPFRPGQQGMKVFGPVKLNSRRLNGAYGLSGNLSIKLFDPQDVKLPFFKNSSNIPITLGANCSYSSLNDNKGNELLVNGRGQQITDKFVDDFYYVLSNFHAYLGFEFPRILSGFRLDLGYGVFQVKNSILGADGLTFVDYYNSKGEDPLYTMSSLYLKAQYNHIGITNYSVSLQYFNESIMLYGVLELFPWLNIEAKYAKLLGTLKPWEDKEFITISPRIILSF